MTETPQEAALAIHTIRNVSVDNAINSRYENQAAFEMADYAERSAKLQGTPKVQASPEITPEQEKATQYKADVAQVQEQEQEAMKEAPDYLHNIIEAPAQFLEDLTRLPEIAKNTLMTMAAPLEAMASFGLAPIANPSNTGDAVQDFQNNFQTAFQAAWSALQGEHPEVSYGTQIAQKMGISEEHVPTAGLLLDLLGDPSITLGLPFMKVIDKGLRAMQKADVLKGTAGSAKNAVTNTVYELLTLGKLPDEAAMTEIGVLAQKVDQGDRAAALKLNDMLNGIPEAEAAARIADQADAAKTLKHFETVLGKRDGASFTIKGQRKIAEIEAAFEDPAKAMPIQWNSLKINAIEDADAAIGEALAHYTKDFLRFAKKQPSIEYAAAMQRKLLEDTVGVYRSGIPEDMPGHLAYAYTQVLRGSAKRLHELAAATKGATSTKLDLLAFERNLAVHRRIYDKLFPTKNFDANRLFHQYNIAGLEGRKLVEGIDAAANRTNYDLRLRLLVRDLLAGTPDPVAASRFATKSALSKTADAIFEVYVNSILSGPITHAVNIASNTTLLAWAPSQAMLEGMSASARATLQGLTGNGAAAREGFQKAGNDFTEAWARVVGTMQGAMDAWHLFNQTETWDSLRLDGANFASGEIARMRLKPAITSENYGLGGNWGRFVDGFGTFIRLPGAALQKEDKAFKLMHYRANVNAAAVRYARKHGKTAADQHSLYRAVRNSPDQFEEAIVEQALKEGELYTFTNELGTLGTKVHDIIKGMPSGRFWIPFFATPTNIVKMGVRNSVFGNVFKDLPYLLEGGVKGDAARAKVAMGTVIPMTIIGAIDEEYITGRVDQTTPAGRFAAAQGYPPYSIRFSKDGDWHSYEKLEPLRSILGLYANWRQAFNAIDTHDEQGQPTNLFEELTIAAIAPVLQTIGDQYMLEQLGGVMNLLNSFQRSDATGTQGAFDQLEKNVKKFGVSFVPASGLLRQVTNTTFDKTYRMADTYVENLMKIIPTLSSQLPPSENVWGEERVYPPGLGPDLISPFKTISREPDKYDLRLIDLGVDVPGVPRKMMVEGITLELNTQQKYQLNKLRAEAGMGKFGLKKQVEAILDHESFNDYSPLEQKKVLDLLFQKATANAKQALLASDPKLQEQLQDKLHYREAFIRDTRGMNK